MTEPFDHEFQLMREIHTALMRGGTSRGPVLWSDGLPSEPAARDAAVLQLVGGRAVQTDALGGGSATTSKLVVVKPVSGVDGLILEYSVAHVIVGRNQVDWTGTCGNMTATVPLFALEEGLIDAGAAASVRLRNTSTNGLVRTGVADAGRHQRGSEARITTEYLEPGGSVFDSVLPTGAALDRISVDGVSYDASLVDVTHPYLFLVYDEVVGSDDIEAAATLARIERIRAQVCVRLGLARDPHEAARTAPSVPRVVLVRGTQAAGNAVAIHVISTGMAISTVPATAAMCMAAAARIPSTVPARYAGTGDATSSLTVVSPAARESAFAMVGPGARVISAGVERTARTILQGRAWI
jgi:2-methylaconitate isomerase